MNFLENLYNKHKNTPAIVMGTGPSLIDYQNQIKTIKAEFKNKLCLIACNDIDTMTTLPFDYWVLASSVYTIPAWANRLNSKDATVIYADSVDLTPREEVTNILQVPYYGYDQRHFNNSDCPVNFCCPSRIKNRKTIQELVQKYSNNENHYDTGDTVALHMLALAIIMGCNPINILGVDLDYSKGYVDRKTHNPDNFIQYNHRLYRDFEILNESAKKMGITIYNQSCESIISPIFQNSEKLFINIS